MQANVLTRGVRSALGWWNGRVSPSRVEQGFAHVRREIASLGLAGEGRYLGAIECDRMHTGPFSRTMGAFFDAGVGWGHALLGYEPGTIYVARNGPVQTHVRGETLRDTIRHEFAHAWAWVDAPYLRRRWFREAFGAGYFEGWANGRPEFDASEFVSAYATTAPKEDFAETFMTFVRSPHGIERFRARPGVYRKLRAVKRAVTVAASERVLRAGHGRS